MADIVQIIKYEGDNSTFIWKHRAEDFNLGSQLIVHESQEAVFFMNGQALDLFGPGRYTLTTQNIPLIGKAVQLVTDGETPFHCEVYFINKTEQIGIKWGTDSLVNYPDPNFNNYPFPIGANGFMNLRVADSRKLLVKVVGTASSLSQDELAAALRGPMMAKIKAYLPSVLSRRKVPVFDIDQHMEEFSHDLHALLAEECDDYGVELAKFWINSFVKPESDPIYAQLRSLRGRSLTDVQEAMLQQQLDIIRQQTKAQKIVMEAQAMAEKRKTEGYTVQEERAFDVAERLAANEGIGSFSSTGIGLGMMGGVAAGIGAGMADIASSALAPTAQRDGVGRDPAAPHEQASSVAAAEPDEPSSAGLTQTPSADSGLSDFEARLAKLEMLKGKISEEQYNHKLQEIMDSI